jgi:hypothetical protein
MSSKSYTSKLTVEIEVKHWGSPKDAINMVESNLKYPAVQSMRFIHGETNYRLWKEPSEQMNNFDVSNPFTLESSPR